MDRRHSRPDEIATGDEARPARRHVHPRASVGGAFPVPLHPVVRFGLAATCGVALVAVTVGSGALFGNVHLFPAFAGITLVAYLLGRRAGVLATAVVACGTALWFVGPRAPSGAAGHIEPAALAGFVIVAAVVSLASGGEGAT